MSLLTSTEEWHFCLVFIVIGFTTLIIGLIYCKQFILLYRTDPVIRARRPHYWCFTIIIHPMMILVRTTVAVLYLNNIIPITIYRIMVTYLALLATTSVFFIRMYLLWFDLKYNRYIQQNLLRKYLLMNRLQNQSNSVQTTNSVSSKNALKKEHSSYFIPETTTVQSYIFDNKSTFGRIKRCIFPLLIFFIICFITITSIYLFNNGYFIGIKILTIWISIVLLLTIYLLQSVWIGEAYHKIHCCNCLLTDPTQSAVNLAQTMSNSTEHVESDSNNGNMIRTFRDDFYIRYELSGSFIIVLIGLIFSLIITTSNTFGNINHKNSFNFGVFLVVTISGLMNLFGFLLYTIIPYYTFQKIHGRLTKTMAKKGMADKSIPLSLLLSHHTGFYAFMEQLVQEIAMENLSSLIEIWQYKYKHIRKSKNMKSGNINELILLYRRRKRKRTKSSKNVTVTKDRNRLSILSIKDEKSDENSIKDPSIHSSNVSHSSNDMELSLSATHSDSGRSLPTLTLQQHLSFSRTRKCDAAQGIALLKSLPWHSLPSGEGQIKYKNKFQQAVFIYNKFYSYSSIDSVNISGNALWEIQRKFKRLEKYMDAYDNNNSDLDGGNNIELDIDIDIDELGLDDDIFGDAKIENEEQFNKALLSVFDASLPDIIDNLHNSLDRFRLTNEYCLLLADKL